MGYYFSNNRNYYRNFNFSNDFSIYLIKRINILHIIFYLMKEIELTELFCKELNKLNVKYKRELRKGSYHNEGYLDIVSITNDSNIDKLYIKLIAYEVKMSSITSAFHQAMSNKYYSGCFLSYVIYPKKPQLKTIEKFKKNGIGLILFRNNSFFVKIKPKINISQKYIRSELGFKKLKRNWIENRSGRIFSNKEINNESEQMNINYNWIGNYDIECPYCERKGFVCVINKKKRVCMDCNKVYFLDDFK